ncbi:MAG: glycosyltransferase family 2 protein [Phycisphaerales bacterium]|nr:glycosyltransferase family 2 protein [Phycisphaerales bacterium]
MPAPSASSPIPTLSVAVVCKDNQSTIGRTLESVRGLAAHIIAIDSGSTDDTIPMLEAAGATVIHSEWLGHIKTKQKAFDACSTDWILSLDSDESPEPELVASIRAALADPGNTDAFALNRRTYYQGRPLRHAWQPEWRVRLVCRGKAAWTGLDPHDVLAPASGAAVERLAGHLRHDSFPTFSEHMRKQWHHATTMAKSLHAAGKRGSRLSLLVSPPGAFLKQLVLKRGFLDGRAGWLAAASTAMAALVKHATLLELDQER